MKWVITDGDLAEEFTRRHGGRVVYVAERRKWWIWNGWYWQIDDSLKHVDLARQVCRDVLAETLPKMLTASDRESLRQRLGSARAVSALLKLARSDPAHARRFHELTDGGQP